eukprot:CAMPEP_0117558696 /NCGR_PEP_ID=MMETSP0784-20121206/52973_1 /TAXON_ID=39447 /ORGANISM="" /LENGTH=375 /DNA_ID=CAMNT_0005356041 /DNA_START=76 /DNA_END=1203 /DNA_ORIENTATION=+
MLLAHTRAWLAYRTIVPVLQLTNLHARVGKGQRSCGHASDIAVLDLGTPDAARHLDAAFRATGFAVVTGHGVAHSALQELREKGLEFFRWPLEEKQTFNTRKGYGFGGYLNQEEAAAQLLGDFSKPQDWVESLTLPGGLPRLSSSEEVDPARPGKDSEVLDAVPSFNEVADRAHAAFLDFRRSLDILVSDALGEDRDFILSKVDPLAAGIRLAYYPAQAMPPVPGQLRYGEHVDSGGLTILVRDELAPWGTQVLLNTGEWADVPIVPGAIVLNVGALLSRWTNGRWRASIHRVANDAAERLSIVSSAVVFKPEAVIQPLPSCVSSDRPPVYAPVTAFEFLTERVKLHRRSYAEEHGLSRAEAEQSLQEQIQQYRM